MDFTFILVVATILTGIFSLIRSNSSIFSNIRELSASIFPVLLFVLVIRSFFLLKSQQDFFIRNCGVGAISFFSLQAIINLGVSVRLLPAKGMTLPFISYGGSSLIASGFLMGLLLACTRKRNENIVQK